MSSSVLGWRSCGGRVGCFVTGRVLQVGFGVLKCMYVWERVFWELVNTSWSQSHCKFWPIRGAGVGAEQLLACLLTQGNLQPHTCRYIYMDRFWNTSVTLSVSLIWTLMERRTRSSQCPVNMSSPPGDSKTLDWKYHLWSVPKWASGNFNKIILWSVGEVEAARVVELARSHWSSSRWKDRKSVV